MKCISISRELRSYEETYIYVPQFRFIKNIQLNIVTEPLYALSKNFMIPFGINRHLNQILKSFGSFSFTL